jgi:hypothetical protein
MWPLSGAPLESRLQPARQAARRSVGVPASAGASSCPSLRDGCPIVSPAPPLSGAPLESRLQPARQVARRSATAARSYRPPRLIRRTCSPRSRGHPLSRYGWHKSAQASGLGTQVARGPVSPARAQQGCVAARSTECARPHCTAAINRYTTPSPRVNHIVRHHQTIASSPVANCSQAGIGYTGCPRAVPRASVANCSQAGIGYTAPDRPCA